MSFNFQVEKIPDDETYLEARSLYNYAFAYFVLDAIILLAAIIIIINGKYGLGILTYLLSNIAGAIGVHYKKAADRLLL